MLVELTKAYDTLSELYEQVRTRSFNRSTGEEMYNAYYCTQIAHCLNIACGELNEARDLAMYMKRED